MDKLGKLRNDLDMCDEIIVDALRMRYQIIQELTAYKKEIGMNTFQPEEEKRKKHRFETKLQDYKYKTSILDVYDSILYDSKKIQSRELFDCNIFLIGFMGVGKSTISKALQKTFALDVIEMDEIIAQQNHMSISEIFDLYGEEYFRNEETKLLAKCQEKKNLIVSCGGGVAMRPINVEEMKKSGLVVLLTADPATILDRVQDSHDRPLLENNKTVEYIQKLMEKRRPHYEAAADLVVQTDGRDVYEICDEILRKTAQTRTAKSSTLL